MGLSAWGAGDRTNEDRLQTPQTAASDLGLIIEQNWPLCVKRDHGDSRALWLGLSYHQTELPNAVEYVENSKCHD